MKKAQFINVFLEIQPATLCYERLRRFSAAAGPPGNAPKG
jgi:hypothetical protein